MQGFLKIVLIVFIFCLGELNFLKAQSLNSDTASLKTEYLAVEKMPEFPGGEDSLYAFIRSKSQYPKNAVEKGIDGTVYIEFVIDSLGKTSNYKILKGIGAGCDEEAIRILKLMPKWTPAEYEGRSVSSYFVLPFAFYFDE